MKWFLSLLVSAATLLSSCAAAPLSPPNLKVIRQTEQSVVRLYHEEEDGKYSICTGFLVDSIHIVTVAHCIMKDMTANGLPIRLIKNNTTLALYEISALLGPPLEIRKKPLFEGEEVIGVGYGLGDLHVFTRHVTVPKYENTEVILDGLMLRGMSGGPVVDLDGKVIGIVQSGHEGTLTVLCGQDELREFLKK